LQEKAIQAVLQQHKTTKVSLPKHIVFGTAMGERFSVLPKTSKITSMPLGKRMAILWSQRVFTSLHLVTFKTVTFLASIFRAIQFLKTTINIKRIKRMKIKLLTTH